jgi:protein-L-isoaspartate O-methyltransferase
MSEFRKQLEAIYAQSLETKKSWYSEVAIAYHQTRPRYPTQMMERVVDLAQLSPNAPILEIGCGPGIATATFAELGFSVVAIEPSQEASALAKENCQNYSNVKIINTTFEEWELEPEKFDAVFATTSFHWLSPDIASHKSAAALKKEGFLILLWNTPPQPPQEIYQQFLQPIYQTYAPHLEGYETFTTYQENLNQFGQQLLDSGHFQNLVAETFISEITYTVEGYIMLLSTLSPYIKLEQQQRNELLTQLKETLNQNCGERLPTSYLSAFHLAQKI